MEGIVSFICEHRLMAEPVLRPKEWRHRKLLSEHGFDKLRGIDCTAAKVQ